MYDCYKDKITENRTENYPLSWVLFENTLYIVIWILAAILLIPIKLYSLPIVTTIWIIVVIFVQIILKKHNCSGCYYYGKMCHLGWGRISPLIYKKDEGNPELGKKYSVFYIISPPIILILSILSGIAYKVEIVHWYILAAFIVLNVITVLLRKVGCGKCAMRLVCPGSAARRE